MSISPDGQIGFGTGQGGDDVNRMHDYDDRDLSPLSHHHTLGIGSAQASPGDHIHDGKTSKSISSGGAGVPATTVVTETAFGQASAVGVGTKYARDDHTHGSPTLTPANAVVTETAFGQAAAIGVITTEFAREDHTHGTPAAPTIPAASGTVVAETALNGAAAVVGVATTYSRGDHSHGTPVVPVKSLDVASTAGLTVLAANTDVPGLTLNITTVKATAQILVNVSLDFRVTAVFAGAMFQGTLFINGVAQAGLITCPTDTLGRGSRSNTWARVVGITAAQVVKVQVNKTSATPTGDVNFPNSRMTILIIDI